MSCEVCGHELRPLSISAGSDRDDEWVCGWCYAVTVAGFEYPAYEPINSRWERAELDGWENQPRHAYGYFGTTLCGLSGEGLSPSPYPWVPDWANACRPCKEAAAVLDGRLPLEKRLPRPIRTGFDPLADLGPPF